MNLKFPNFNFDTWCADFTLLLDSLNRERHDDLPTDNWIEQYVETRQIFFDQNHLVFNDEEYNTCYNYIQYLTIFNEFMDIIMNGRYNSYDDLIATILLLRYPLLTNPVAISKALRRGKSFKTRYTLTGPTLLFNPITLSLIDKFITEHNIPILDDI
jgi:hypothetical protein